jgi:hypothetical protein
LERYGNRITVKRGDIKGKNQNVSGRTPPSAATKLLGYELLPEIGPGRIPNHHACG